LDGTIPQAIENLTALQFLYLSNNKISGKIPDLSKLSQLQQLGLDTNSISGVIPTSLGQCKNLQTLFLQENLLTGGLSALGSLTLVQYMYLSRNKIEGTIPRAIAQNRLLQQIGIDFNRISGTIPSQFGNVQYKLFSFFAQNNKLTGRFNGNLCQVPNCDTSGNIFSCPVPVPPCCKATCANLTAVLY